MSTDLTNRCTCSGSGWCDVHHAVKIGGDVGFPCTLHGVDHSKVGYPSNTPTGAENRLGCCETVTS